MLSTRRGSSNPMPSTIVQYLRSFDWLGLGLISAIFGYLFGVPWRKSLQEEPWRLSFIPIASVALIYLPVYAGEFDPGRRAVLLGNFPLLDCG